MISSRSYCLMINELKFKMQKIYFKRLKAFCMIFWMIYERVRSYENLKFMMRSHQSSILYIIIMWCKWCNSWSDISYLSTILHIYLSDIAWKKIKKYIIIWILKTDDEIFKIIWMRMILWFYCFLLLTKSC